MTSQAASMDMRASATRSTDLVRLAEEIATIRANLTDLVDELDRRRRELMDVRLQARRHPLALVAGLSTAVGLVALGVMLGVRSARRTRSLAGRARHMRDAAARAALEAAVRGGGGDVIARATKRRRAAAGGVGAIVSAATFLGRQAIGRRLAKRVFAQPTR